MAEYVMDLRVWFTANTPEEAADAAKAIISDVEDLNDVSAYADTFKESLCNGNILSPRKVFDVPKVYSDNVSITLHDKNALDAVRNQYEEKYSDDFNELVKALVNADRDIIGKTIVDAGYPDKIEVTTEHGVFELEYTEWYNPYFRQEFHYYNMTECSFKVEIALPPTFDMDKFVSAYKELFTEDENTIGETRYAMRHEQPA